jgi:hypothetical protein
MACALVGTLGYVLGGILVTAIQGYILRFLLWQTHTFPWKAEPFLEDATTRILLQRFGGGYYSFIHRLLLDYFADLGEHLSLPSTAEPSTPPLTP